MALKSKKSKYCSLTCLEKHLTPFQHLCNCDAGGDINVDEGTLTNKNQLPVMKLNYGGSDGRFSWILYKVENLKCWGKAGGVRYPSEYYQTKFETIEKDIQENADQITNLFELADEAENEITILQDQTTENENNIASNDNDISGLKSRTTALEGEVITNDYYFKYQASR